MSSHVRHARTTALADSEQLLQIRRRAHRLLGEEHQVRQWTETGCPARYYLPAEDVRLDLLTPSDTHTVCPFKGTASYWSLPDAADLVWAYPDPKPDVARIKDHLCFYEAEVS
jgi:uncharacterized protein (DUF427 family)